MVCVRSLHTVLKKAAAAVGDVSRCTRATKALTVELSLRPLFTALHSPRISTPGAAKNALAAMCALWQRRSQLDAQAHSLLRSARRRTVQHAWPFSLGGTAGQAVEAQVSRAATRVHSALRNPLAV